MWYSAGWTQATLYAFHASVAALLKKNLCCWSSRLSRSRNFCKHGKHARFALRLLALDGKPWIADLHRTGDRTASCVYVVSGGIPQAKERSSSGTKSAQVSTGPVVMSSEAEHSNHSLNVTRTPRTDENFLCSFAAHSLVEQRLQGGNFVEAGAQLTKRRVEALRSALQSNQFKIQVLLPCSV